MRNRGSGLGGCGSSAGAPFSTLWRWASSIISRSRSNSAGVGDFESSSATITRSRAPSKTRSTNRLVSSLTVRSDDFLGM